MPYAAHAPAFVPERAALELVTARLVLRDWRAEDGDAFARINADPEVMSYLAEPLDRPGSDRLMARIRAHIDVQHFGLWAVEAPGLAPFIGYVGLQHVPFQAHFTPAVEIGWRLDRRWWGRGLATEAANAALRFAFEQLQLPELVSFTVPGNLRSRAVMERIGMRCDPGDEFDHPLLPDGHRLRRHVLYRLRADARRPEHARSLP